MKNKCIKVLASLVLSIMLLNYIGNTVVFAVVERTNETFDYNGKHPAIYRDTQTGEQYIYVPKEYNAQTREWTDDKVYEIKDGKVLENVDVVFEKDDSEEGGISILSKEERETQERIQSEQKDTLDAAVDAVKNRNSDSGSSIKNAGDNVGSAAEKQKEQEIIKQMTDYYEDNKWGYFTDGLVGVLTIWLRTLVVSIGNAARILATLTARSAGTVNDEKTLMITPDQILFNRLAITDINFFQGNTFGTGSSKTSLSGANNPIAVIRNSIANWYNALRTIAIIILLCVLIYIGIRMAISTVAEEKAVYKQWLWNWLVSMALLFVLHYLIVIVISANNSLVDILYKARGNYDVSKINDYVSGLALQGIFSVQSGIAAWSYVVTYIAIVAFTLIFLIMYIKRMITVAFLIIISPLITITYSIDKIGDNKSQALNKWFREFMEAVLIQPFHCIIYVVFIAAAMQCITDYGTLAPGVITVMCLFFVFEAEKIVKDIFGIETGVTGDSLKTALAVGGTLAAMNKWIPNKNKPQVPSNVPNQTPTNNLNLTTSNNKVQSNLATQNINKANNQVPIYNGNGNVASTVTRNSNTIGATGTIIPGNAQNYTSATTAYNQQLNNGTLSTGGVITPSQNSQTAQAQPSIILPGGNGTSTQQPQPSVFNQTPQVPTIPVANGQPISSANSGASQPINLAPDNTSDNYNGSIGRQITGATTTWGKIWTGAKLLGKTQIGGFGTAMGIVGATSAGIGGKGLGDAITAGVAAKALGDNLADRAPVVGPLDNTIKNLNIKKGERDFTEKYNSYKNSSNLSHQEMMNETNKFRQMSNKDIEKNLTGDAKAYARALKAMPVIYEENGKSDTDQELVSVLNRIRSSGNTSNSSSSNANNGSSNGSSSNNSNSTP